MTDLLDNMTVAIDDAIRTLFAEPQSSRPHPTSLRQLPLSDQARKQSGSLMRVNHVGEICAQAMYSAQTLVARDAALKKHFTAAGKDEADHLAWTSRRLTELGARPSALNPLWYAGAFAIGLAAGRVNDGISLGFVVETERQVEQHLKEHLKKLPEDDLPSRAIVNQMCVDESQHAIDAIKAGSTPLPQPVCSAMRIAAKFMTKLSYHI